MMKWFEEVNRTRPAVICSRVRLVRNLEQYAFPSRLDGKMAEEMQEDEPDSPLKVKLAKLAKQISPL